MKEILANNIPNQWFFCNPFKNSNERIIEKLSKKTGVVFFFEKPFKNSDFVKAIGPLTFLCRKKKIIFLIQSTFFWASKYKAQGILMDKNNKFLCNMVSLNLLKTKFFLAIKVHSFIEAVKFSNNTDLIFISNVFRTNSHPERKELGVKNFIKLCVFLKKNLNYALGGMSKKNLARVQNKNLNGFGAISYFRK